MPTIRIPLPLIYLNLQLELRKNGNMRRCCFLCHCLRCCYLLDHCRLRSRCGSRWTSMIAFRVQHVLGLGNVRKARGIEVQIQSQKPEYL
jgi:hypothetical protein